MTNADNPKQASSDYQPSISVIIPALNSEKTLDACLDAISLIDYPKDKLEAILVDNGSTDTTIKIVQKYDVKVFVQPKINISALRNFGAGKAKGDILAFVDSDCLVAVDWLNNALVHFQRKDVGAVGCGYSIPKNATWVERNWYWRYRAGVTAPKFIPSGNFLIRKELFDKMEGFNPLLQTGEDSEFCLKIRKAGYKLVSDSKIRSVHLGNPRTLSQFLRKEIWYGKGMPGTVKLEGINKPFLLSHLFLFALIGLIIGIVLMAWTKDYILLVSSTIILFLIPVSSAFYRAFRSKSILTFFPLIPMYFAFCMGRMISLLYIYHIIKE